MTKIIIVKCFGLVEIYEGCEFRINKYCETGEKNNDKSIITVDKGDLEIKKRDVDYKWRINNPKLKGTVITDLTKKEDKSTIFEGEITA